ncbi:MAG: hypothetical protein ACRD12_19420 [Acidimicrobiales bacterium]
MEVLNAERSEDLTAMQRRLHDVWLQLPETMPIGTVRLEGLDDRETLLPVRTFGPFAQFERRRAKVVLVVDHVVAAELIDAAQIGSLNFANISFDEGESTVHLEGHVPVKLRLRVDQLEVRVEITDETVAAGRTWGLRPRSSA